MLDYSVIPYYHVPPSLVAKLNTSITLFPHQTNEYILPGANITFRYKLVQENITINHL